MTGDPKLRDGSWNRTAVRSLTVREYKMNDPNNARPKPEVLMKGDRFQIFTGAQVTRKRNLTFKGVLTAIYEAGKTWGKSIWFFNAKVYNTGRKRRDRNAVLNAGQKFDRGVNKLVEDMANGEKMSDGSPDQMTFNTRTEVLYKQAKILKARGPFSDDQIAERFRVNLMESLRVLHAARGKAVHDKVLKDLTQNVLPKFEKFVGSPAKDEDADKDQKAVPGQIGRLGLQEFREEQTFDRSVVVAGLRDAATFGSDEEKFKAFGGSRILHDVYKGNTDLLQASGGDVLAASGFNGDADAYRKWGGCAPFYKKFRGNSEALAGQDGAKVLRAWLNKTYGQGSGDAFFDEHRKHQNGITDEKDLHTLGILIQTELEDYKGLGFNKLDLKSDNVVNGLNTPLSYKFDRFVKTVKKGEAFGNWPAVQGLRELETLRGKAAANAYDKDTLRTKIKDWAEKFMAPDSASKSAEPNDAKDDIKDDIKIKFDQKYATEADQTSDVCISTEAKKVFRRAIAKKQADYSQGQKIPTMAKSLDDLKGLDKDQLMEVLNKGLFKAYNELHTTVQSVLDDFGKIRVAKNNRRTHNRYMARLIDDAYGLDPQTGTSIKQVNQRRRSKRTEALDENVDKTRIDGRDLRIIEKEMYKEGFVFRGLNQAPKRNKPGPELQIMEKNKNPLRNESGQIKADIGDEESPIDGRKDAVIQLTGGYSKDAVFREFDKLSQENSIHLDSQTKFIVKSLNRISEEGKVAARFVRHLPFYVNGLLKNDVIQKNDAYADLKHILQTMKTNLEKAAANLPANQRFVIGVDENFLLDDDDKTDPQSHKNDPGPVDDIKTDIKKAGVSMDEPDKIINPQKHEIDLGADESYEIDVDPAELKKDINPKQYGIMLDGAKQTIIRKKEKLSRDLAAAGNNNVEAGKQNGMRGDPCSVDFAKDIKNGIVNMYVRRHDQTGAPEPVTSPAYLTQDMHKLRLQDVAFVTGALSTTSLVSNLLPNQVIFLKGKQNAFSHPDMAKGVDPDKPLYHDAEAITISPELGDDYEPTGRYRISVRLNTNFDQIKLGNGQTIDVDPNSEVGIKLFGEIDCTQANDQSGGSIDITWADVDYKGVTASQ